MVLYCCYVVGIIVDMIEIPLANYRIYKGVNVRKLKLKFHL